MPRVKDASLFALLHDRLRFNSFRVDVDAGVSGPEPPPVPFQPVPPCFLMLLWPG